MTLWIILTVMTSAAAVLLSAPFIRRLDRPQAETAGDIEVYRDQLKEVESEQRQGLIDDAQAEAARTRDREARPGCRQDGTAGHADALCQRAEVRDGLRHRNCRAWLGRSLCRDGKSGSALDAWCWSRTTSVCVNRSGSFTSDSGSFNPEKYCCGDGNAGCCRPGRFARAGDFPKPGASTAASRPPAGR